MWTVRVSQLSVHPFCPTLRRITESALYWVNLSATADPPVCSMRPVNTAVQCA